MNQAEAIAKWQSVSWPELEQRAGELVEDMRQSGIFVNLSVKATPKTIAAFFSMFHCQRCQDSCCLRETTEGIILVGQDVERMASILKISAKQFKRDYTFTDKRGRLLNSPCPFFIAGSPPGCKVWPHGPNVCKLYPVNKPGQTLLVNPHCPEGRRLAEIIIRHQAINQKGEA